MCLKFSLISNVSARLSGFLGDSIVLEENGAKVTRDNVLILISEKLLMILDSSNPESVWKEKLVLDVSIFNQDVPVEATPTLPIVLTLDENQDAAAVSTIPWQKLQEYDEELFTFLESGGSYSDFNRPGSTGYVSRLSNFILTKLESQATLVTSEQLRCVVKEIGNKYPVSLRRLLPSGNYHQTATNLLCVIENRRKTKSRAPHPKTKASYVGSSLPINKRARFHELLQLSENSLPEPTITDEEAAAIKIWLQIAGGST